MNEDAGLRYSTFWRRFWAGIIDSIVFIPFLMLDSFMYSFETLAVLLPWSLVSYSVWFVYSVWMHTRFGQTIGKMAMGVRVMDLSESRLPTLKQCLFRDSGYIIINVLAWVFEVYGLVRHAINPETLMPVVPGLILSAAHLVWLLLELGTMLSNDKRRALHDWIAGTVVVRC